MYFLSLLVKYCKKFRINIKISKNYDEQERLQDTFLIAEKRKYVYG